MTTLIQILSLLILKLSIMNESISLLFYLKKSKNYINGHVSIYARITINGNRSEFSTGHKCSPEKWNSNGGKPLGHNEEAKTLQKFLDTIKNKVYEAYNKLIIKNILITGENLKNEYFGISEKSRNLIEIFKDHNNKVETLLGQEYAPGTLERYKTSLKHTEDFLKWQYKISDIDIKAINHAFITDYEFYLRSERKCNNNTAVKYIKNFGKIIRICIANGWLEKNPFANYKAKVREVERVFLSKEDLEIVTSKEFKTRRLNQIRDIFLFSCYTGLAYADVKKLDGSQIVIGIDGGQWIHTNRQKTDTRSNIPLLPQAQAILDKYKDNIECINKGKILPILSNQKMNEYLKEIATLCGIEKDFTYHTARHTFATTVTLSNGVPIESVSKMLGHKDLKTTQHYAKILDSKVSEDMKLLKQRMLDSSSVILKGVS
jgi:site-specific recombinase XerD